MSQGTVYFLLEDGRQDRRIPVGIGNIRSYSRRYLKLQCLLVSGASFICPQAKSRFLTDIQIGLWSFLDSSADIWFSNSFMFGMCSLFSRRFSREKCPTLTVSSFFFFFFFFSVDNLTLSGPLFLQFCNSAQKANFTPKGPPFSFYFFKETYTTGRAQRVPPLDFFRHCATFFRKFLKFIKGYPLAFFLKFSVCRKR